MRYTLDGPPANDPRRSLASSLQAVDDILAIDPDSVGVVQDTVVLGDVLLHHVLKPNGIHQSVEDIVESTLAALVVRKAATRCLAHRERGHLGGHNGNNGCNG